MTQFVDLTRLPMITNATQHAIMQLWLGKALAQQEAHENYYKVHLKAFSL
jgi:hypothetical protein